MIATQAPFDFTAVKSRQQATSSSGDYAVAHRPSSIVYRLDNADRISDTLHSAYAVVTHTPGYPRSSG